MEQKTIGKIIEMADKRRPNAFTQEQKLQWIANLDAKLAVDVLLMSAVDAAVFCYSYPEDMERTPLVNFPHDSIYDAWLDAQIDYNNGEYDKYANSMARYNAEYDNFLRWFAAVYEPALGYKSMHGRPFGAPYYISAYAISVKLGFRGTVAQWEAYLHGKDGLSPHIGENGNWWIGESDSGILARGDRGAAFTYADFTPQQLEALKGAPGKDFKYEDFTPEQLTALTAHLQNGKDGYTPVRGTDYWTVNDQTQIKEDVMTQLDARIQTAIAEAIGGSY